MKRTKKRLVDLDPEKYFWCYKFGYRVKVMVCLNRRKDPRSINYEFCSKCKQTPGENQAPSALKKLIHSLHPSTYQKK